MVEWLRQWTSDLMEALRTGSIPDRSEFFVNDDDGGASRKAPALMRMQSTKPEGAKQPRMRVQSTKPQGAK